MTASVQPDAITEATLDAAVDAGTVAHHDRFCLSRQSDWHRGDDALDCVASYRPATARIIAAALPILAAAIDAQARADERERIARTLSNSAAMHRAAADDCFQVTLHDGPADFVAMHDRLRVQHLAAATALEEHHAAIGRAGTSGVTDVS